MQSQNELQKSITVVHETYENNVKAQDHLQYEKDYEYLKDQNYQGSYLQLSNFKVEPQYTDLSVVFYEQIEKIQEENQQIISHGKQLIQKPIVRTNVSHCQKLKEVIRLPFSNKISIEIEINKEGFLEGKINYSQNSTKTILSDKQGIQKAILYYQIQAKNQKEIQISRVKQQQNGHRQTEDQHVYQNLRVLNEQLQNSTATLHNSSEISLKPQNRQEKITYSRSKMKKRYQNKSKVDYRDQDQIEPLSNRIASYKVPLSSKESSNKHEQRQSINMDSIRRNQEQLGIASRDLQSLFYPIYQGYNHIQTSQEPFPTPIYTKKDHSYYQNFEQKSLNQDTGNNIEYSKDIGIGTHSALPSRLTSVANSNKSNKSHGSLISKKAKKELVSQIIQEYEGLKKQQKVNDVSLKHYNMIDPIIEEPDTNQSSYRIQKHQNLIAKPKVFDLKIQNSPNGQIQSKILSKSSFNSGRLSQQSKTRKNEKRYVVTEQNDGQQIRQFDLLINNMNVNFHKKTFGTKYVEIEIFPNIYKTDQLAGNNLIWIGKNYRFQRVNTKQELTFSVRKSDEESEIIIGKVKICLTDIINNKKQSYYQTLLLGRNQVLANVIIGFEIFINHEQPYYSVFRNKTTHMTEKTKIRNHNQRVSGQQLQFSKMPEARANIIKLRKYLGGKNIKIGKSIRFYDEQKNIPGPGDYQIQSTFSRHAYKQQ